MNAIKAISFSVLLSLSVAGTAAADESTTAIPDLSGALQKQIESRMEAELGADLLAIAQPEPVIVVRGETRRVRNPAS